MVTISALLNNITYVTYAGTVSSSVGLMGRTIGFVAFDGQMTKLTNSRSVTQLIVNQRESYTTYGNTTKENLT